MRFPTLATVVAFTAPFLVTAVPTKFKRAADADILVLSAYHSRQILVWSGLLIALCCVHRIRPSVGATGNRVLQAGPRQVRRTGLYRRWHSPSRHRRPELPGYPRP